MKKIVLTALLLCCSLLSAQDKKSLEERAKKSMEYTINGNYPALMELTYPKLFTIVPKEKMLEMLPAALKGEGFSVKLLNQAPNYKFGEIKKIDGGHYSLINHDTYMAMTFDEPLAKEDADMMLESLKESISGTVTYDAAKNTFNIKKPSELIAVADKSTNNQWTFISNQGGPLIGMLFSEKVQKELGITK